MQMYKVFIDNCLFIFTTSNDIPHIEGAITICIKKVDDVKNIINKFASMHSNDSIIIIHDNIEELVAFFENIYIIKVAAGGWVFNGRGELLMINRYNHWDIPKGHIEHGESFENCAIREVSEETGVGNLSIVKNLGISRHIFRYSAGEPEILKITHWYRMESNFEGLFIPQHNEDIQEVEWVNSNKLKLYLPTMYRSLREFYFDNIIE